MEKILIGGKEIGEENEAYIIAEMSGNHNGDIDRALRIVEAAAESGVDGIKLQTYTADTITLDCNNKYFRTLVGSLWEGRTLHDLYEEAHTPWEWHEPIMKRAKDRRYWHSRPGLWDCRLEEESEKTMQKISYGQGQKR